MPSSALGRHGVDPEMIKYYLSRYMDMGKCAEIKRESTCLLCGSDLEGRHETDFGNGSVREYSKCPQCQHEPLVTQYPLH